MNKLYNQINHYLLCFKNIKNNINKQSSINITLNLEINNLKILFNNIKNNFDNISMENIINMYNKFIKAPKTTENQSTMNFNINKKCVFIDKKNNELDLSEISLDSEVECISQLKYIMFSKDNCFTIWEMQSAKIHRKINKVPAYGFIEVEEPDSENDEVDVEEIIKFF
jgi:hypothetical protein